MMGVNMKKQWIYIYIMGYIAGTVGLATSIPSKHGVRIEPSNHLVLSF